MIVYGHRGSAGEAPENTIAGCQHAVARGVRHIEIDLQLAHGDELVVIHDTTIKRTVGMRGRVGDLTTRELAKLDQRACGPPWPNKRHTGVPSLDALVQALPEIESFQLELKGRGAQYNARLVDALVEWLGDDCDGMIVTSSEPSLIESVKQRIPEVNTGYVSILADPTDVLRRCECSYLIAHWSNIMNPIAVRQLRKMGVHISVWTVNEASTIKSLHRMKIDSVISDYVSMALPLVAELSR